MVGGIHRIAAAVAAITLVALPSLAAADPWKDESGHGGGKGGYKYEEKYERGGVKREWKSGDCKYEYKSGRGGVKEEYKCDGPGRHAGPHYWVPPGHRGRVYPAGPAPLPLDLGIGRCNREVIGQLLGGAAGAAAGSQIGSGSGRLAAIAAGTLAGFFLGGDIGRTMDRTDHLCIDEALENAPDGRTIAWQNPDGRGQYEVTPRGTYEATDGRYCREYTAKSTVGGKPAQTYGTACRQPDGSWQIVN